MMKALDNSCAIMQPTYIPWIGYFDLMDSVDAFVFLDDVQWAKASWQVRNRIKTIQGELYLSISIKRTERTRLETQINEALLNDRETWREKHIRSISLAYRKSDFFEQVFPLVVELLRAPLKTLGDFNINIIKTISEKIGIKTRFLRSSELIRSSASRGEGTQCL